MALITKIRNQSALLIGAIGIAMLLFIVGGDFLSSSTGIFSTNTDLGEIAGKNILFRDFEERLQQEIFQAYGTTTVEESVRESAKNALWNLLVHEGVMYPEYDELGLGVSAEELFNQIKSTDPSSRLARYFTDPKTGRVAEYFANPQTGAIDPDKVVAYIQQLFSSQQTAQWIPIEKDIKIDRLSGKYLNLIKKGLYITSKEADEDNVAHNKRLKIKYVVKKYDAVPDSAVTVSDKEIKEYYDDNKEQPEYIQKEEARGIEYIVFEVNASESDKVAHFESLNKIKEKFIRAVSDTMFVKENADTPGDIKWYGRGDFPAEVDSLIFNAPDSTVIGPYTDGDNYKLAKVIKQEYKSDSVDARHILIKIAEGDTLTGLAKALAKADSLKNVILKKKNFKEMATQFSEDFGSAQDGGNLKWFTEGMMVQPFNDSCFNGKVGDMPIVTSQFGVHLIEILNKTTPVRKNLVAVVDRVISPGKKTYEEMYNKASAFSINNDTPEKFRQNGKEQGILVADGVRDNDKVIGGLESPREIIRWIYQEDKGSVSRPFELNNKFVIAHLYQANEKGPLPLEDVKDKIKTKIIKEKKAQQFIDEMKGASGIDDIAGKKNLTVESAEEVSFFSGTLPGVGVEREVVGKLFSLQKGQISVPLKGNNGVYIVTVDEIKDAPQAQDNKSAIMRLHQGLTSRVDYEVFNSLQESANIVDKRGRFY